MDYGSQFNVAVADAPASVRADFIKKTYAHLGAAILAFVAVEYFLFSSGAAYSIAQTMLGGRGTWLFVMLLFMGASAVANHFSSPSQPRNMQYVGLGLYVLAEALIFVPILFIAVHFSDASVIPTAGLYTLIVFGGMTGVVFLTGKDFSFMRQGLMVASFAVLGLIVCSLIFGFTLGTVFSAVMVAFSAAYILYHTSNVLHRYPVGSHVAASLQLFASVMLLLWYILRILMSRRS
jgi:FtsH-binding integral membrane protein